MTVRSFGGPVASAGGARMSYLGRGGRRGHQRGSRDTPRVRRPEGRAPVPARLSDLDRRQGPGRRSPAPSPAACALLFVVIFGDGRRSVRLGTSAARLCSSGRSQRVLRQRRRTAAAGRSARRLCCRCSPCGPRSCAELEALSRRELQVLEMIATGAKNAADRRAIRDLAEHRQVPRQPDTAEAARHEPHGGGLPLHRDVRGPLALDRWQTIAMPRRSGSDHRGERNEGDGVGPAPRATGSC